MNDDLQVQELRKVAHRDSETAPEKREGQEMTKTQTKERDAPLLDGVVEQVQPADKPASPRSARKNAVAVKSETAPAAPASETDHMLAMIERAARDPSVDVPKMRELMTMRKEFIAERAEQLFNDKMTAAQTEIGVVVVDKTNKQTSSKYASYPALDRAIRPIYSKHKFALSFDTEEGAPADCIRVVCFVSCSGHTRKHHIDMPADGKGAKGGDVMTKTHATGSGVSYGMRYLLKMIFNIATGEDDDGSKAGAKIKESADLVLISKAQMAEIIKAIEFCGVGERKFCGHYKIDKVPDLPAALYEDALLACKNYVEKKSG